MTKKWVRVFAQKIRPTKKPANQVDQDSIERIDMVGTQLRRILEGGLGDTACGITATVGLAVPDDFIKARDEQCPSRRQTCSRRNPAPRNRKSRFRRVRISRQSRSLRR
jgi:hypothetical protein